MPAPFWDRFTEGYEGKTFADNPYDTVRINGTRLPGRCKLEVKPSLRVDRQKANGKDGATVIVRGVDPSPVKIKVTLWTREQLEAWQEFVDRYWRPPGKTLRGDKAAGTYTQQSALDIGHPRLEGYGITSFVITSITPPDPDELGIGTAEIEGIQYIPPQTKTATRKAEGSNRVPLAQAFGDPKNTPVLKPSQTQGLSFTLPQTPASGSF